MKTTIWLVEDDEFIRDGVSRLLEQEGYAVTGCACVQEARARLGSGTPDLLVLDMVLPDGSGLELCREIRRRGGTVPILFLTCRDEDEDILRGLDSGADDYVTKPFRAQILLSRIRALLRRSRTGQETGRTAGDLRFDSDRQCCYLRGALLPLTPIEYRILHTLARRAEQIVPREELLHAIWESGGEYLDENTLSVHISRLRAKLGVDSGRLVTVRGEGYGWRETDGR